MPRPLMLPLLVTILWQRPWTRWWFAGLLVVIGAGTLAHAQGDEQRAIAMADDALRLARQPHGLRQLHRVSIPFLLVCAPLVYLVSRCL